MRSTRDSVPHTPDEAPGAEPGHAVDPASDAVVDRGDRTLVVGAGPAGLSVAVALQARGLGFDLVDAGERIGGIWDIERRDTPMYESAHFISSRTRSGFRGFPMPEHYPDYPRHEQVLRYIQAFARSHGLDGRAELGTRVVCARPEASGERWRVELDSGARRRYGSLVVATGASWHPRLPDVPGRFEGHSMHAFEYRSPDQLRGRRVLVVGGGNSGCDIACDAARVAEKAFMSVRRGYRFVPKYVFGRPADVFAHSGPSLPAWLERRLFGFLLDRVLVGDLRRYGLPRPDHAALESHPILNTQVLHHLGHGDLEAVPDVRELRAGSVVFADGREETVDLVLWATGYRRAFPFLADDDLDRTDAGLDLYLNVFHRRRASLAFAGLFETDDAAYELMGLQAELIAGALHDAHEGTAATARFAHLRATARPDLRGGRRYLPTPRHAYYVHGATYRRVLLEVGRTMGWLRDRVAP